jgi:hypothetical protein
MHTPPDGINHGTYEFEEVCFVCRARLDTAIQATIWKIQNPERIEGIIEVPTCK